MEYPKWERNVQEIVVTNPIILTSIFTQTSTPLKTCRLVCNFWNEIVLSLSNTRLALNITAWETNPFLKQGFGLDARLAKRINLERIPFFGLKLIHFCHKYSDRVQILDIFFPSESCLSSVYLILKNFCPNLKQLRISCKFNEPNPGLLSSSSFSLKQKLTLFTLRSNAVTPYLASFAQRIVTASPNLREVTLPWGLCPQFVNSPNLESLTIALDGIKPSDLAHANDKFADLSRMLNQVGDQLVKLCFQNVSSVGVTDLDEDFDDFESRIKFQLPSKMPKLRTFRNEMMEICECDDLFQDIERLETLEIGNASENSKCVEQVLQNICKSNKILARLKNLEVIGMHDHVLFAELTTVFPNLERLKVDTFAMADDEENEMHLDVVLEACGDWKQLKHLDLALPTRIERIMDFFQTLWDNEELFQRLRSFTLEIDFSDEIYDLSEDEMDLFKDVLLATKRMDRVKIKNLHFTKKSKEEILTFMKLNKMSVSKFSVVGWRDDDNADEDHD